MAPKKDLEAPNVPIALSVLIKRKERCFEQIQTIFDLSKNINDDQARDLFLLRINEIDTLKSTFEKIIFSIFEKELENDQSSLLHSQDLKNFEDLYYRTKLVASKYGPNYTSNKEQVPSTESRPRLPKLELFNFDGEIENFTTFYETFCSLVHNQLSISKIDKFHYLLSCTKGSALNIVKSVPISASNYDVVWQSLLNKYQDKRMLVGRYLDKMLNFTPLIKETSAHLNTFIENFEHSYKAIEALNINNLGSYILCHIALRALDPHSRKSFEQQIDQNSIPGFTDLVSFVHNHIKVLDHSASYSCSNNSKIQTQNKTQFPKNKQYKAEQSSLKNYTHASSNSKNVMLCAHCGENHMIYRCSQFRKLTSAERVSRAASLGLCNSCLKYHEGECKSTFVCAACQNPHHFLLHIDGAAMPSVSNAATAVPPRSVSICDNTALTNHHASSMHSYTTVVLGTAIVRVKDRFNSHQHCRVLIDSGAQSNFISIDCLKRLGLSRRKCPINIYGIAGDHVKNEGMTSLNIKPCRNDTLSFNIDAVVLTKITSDLPAVEIPQYIVNEYNNLVLADPQFYKTAPIDIILGCDVFPHVYDGKKIIFDHNIPAALNSVFGYVISGKLAVQTSSNQVVTFTTSLVSYTSEVFHLDDPLKTFLEVESSPCETPIGRTEKIEKIDTEERSCDSPSLSVSPRINSNYETLGSFEQFSFDYPQCHASMLTQGCQNELSRSYQTFSEICTYNEPKLLLISKGYDLIKRSNDRPEFLPTHNIENNILKINFEHYTLSNSLKVLELNLFPSANCLYSYYKLTDFKSLKRLVVALLASIFSPVGYILLCTFFIKCIMQILWQIVLRWDNLLSIEKYEKWKRAFCEVPTLADVRIERHSLLSYFSNVHVIGDCDASSSGYASSVYLRSVDEDGRVQVQLLTRKSKVGQLELILYNPRLKLLAAVLLAMVLGFVIKNLNDSYSIVVLRNFSVVLSWLQLPPNLKTFVSSRASAIIIYVIPPNHWYPEGNGSSSDLWQCGTLPSQLLAVEITWLHRPEWLLQDLYDWPTCTFFVKNVNNFSKLQSNVDLIIFSLTSSESKVFTKELEDTFYTFLSLYRLQRILTRCYRFITILISSSNRITYLNYFELAQTRDTIMHVIKSNRFGSKTESLNKRGCVVSPRNLPPFGDPDGLVMVGGKIYLL